MAASEGDRLTQQAYLDPAVVAGYVAEHGKKPKLIPTLEHFAALLPGQRVLDLGMGPGQDSWHLADLGFNVVGVDFSPEMVHAAENLESSPNRPTFLEGDMTQLAKMFPENSFDGAWVSASLLHIARERESYKRFTRSTTSHRIRWNSLYRPQKGRW